MKKFMEEMYRGKEERSEIEWQKVKVCGQICR